MSDNPYDKIKGSSGQTSDDPIQNAFNNYATYYGEGNTGLQDTIFGSWFNPGIEQDKEFAQQVALQQMQNEWNSETARMNRMKEAGINANAAAQGIAGSGNAPATGSPNSAVGAGAQSLNSAAQAAGAANGALDSAMNAYEKLSLTDVERDKRKAEIRNLLSSALHNDWLAYSISELLPLQKDNQRADTYLKLANFDKAREEKKLITNRIDEVQAHITELKEQVKLLEKQGNLVDAEKLRVQAQTEQIGLQNDKLQWDKDWRERFRYDPNSPVDVALEQAMVNDAGDDVVNAIGKSVIDMSYTKESGALDAQAEEAYSIAYNKEKGSQQAESEYIERKQWYKEHEAQIKEFYKFYYSMPKDFRQGLMKFINLPLDDALGSADKPKPLERK